MQASTKPTTPVYLNSQETDHLTFRLTTTTSTKTCHNYDDNNTNNSNSTNTNE